MRGKVVDMKLLVLILVVGDWEVVLLRFGSVVCCDVLGDGLVIVQ